METRIGRTIEQSIILWSTKNYIEKHIRLAYAGKGRETGYMLGARTASRGGIRSHDGTSRYAIMSSDTMASRDWIKIPYGIMSRDITIPLDVT